MDFADERYVRVYTRDTPTMKLLRWEGRMVFFELLRKVDRAGVLDFGDEGVAEAVSAVTDIPLEYVTVGLQRILDRGCAVLKDHSLVIVKFLEAQETPQSDNQRKRESRAKRRDLAKHGVTIRDVTKRDPHDLSRDTGVQPPNVTKPDGGATLPPAGGTKPTENVTLYCAVPDRAVPDPSNLQGTAKDLTGSARAAAPPKPQQPENGPPKPPDGPPIKIPCPVDLWERMPEPTKLTLDSMLIPRDAQEYLCRGFSARYAGRGDDHRREDHWVAGAVRAIQADWHDPKKRPRATTPTESGIAPATSITEYKGAYKGRSFA